MQGSVTTCLASTLEVGGRAADLRALTRISTDDMLGALGLGHVRTGRWILEWLCRRPAARFARQVAGYDRVVGEKGLAAGGAWALERFAPGWRATGQDRVPGTGPLLVASNHPGLCDTVMLFAAIPRSDLLVIAADRPFLRALPNTSRHLLVLGDSTSSSLGVVREAARHLRRGGAVLTFLGGEIEPDPAVLPGALDALDRWSASLDLFIRLVPNVSVVPAVVSGVLSPAAQRHPLTRLRRSRKAREWMGAMLQIIAPTRWPTTPAVAFGHPIWHPTGHAIESVARVTARAEGRGASADAQAAAAEIRRLVLAEARELIVSASSASRPVRQDRRR